MERWRIRELESECIHAFVLLNDHVDISCQEVDWKIFGEIFLWYQFYVYPSGITSYLV